MHVAAGEDALDSAVTRLVADARVSMSEQAGKVLYTSTVCVIPVGDASGWESAVFDHYQAMVTAICTKLRLGKTRSSLGEHVGGSTYGFDVCEGHPFQGEVLGFLQGTRDRAVDLRKRVEAFNADHPAPESGLAHVIAYVGQTVAASEEDGEEE